MRGGVESRVFTEDDSVYGPINTHLAKTTTNEVGHLLGTGPMYDEYIPFSIEGA